MARAATTSDVYNAIAEPRRREIIEALAASDERSVNELVAELRLPQPTVSKHLGVLRKVGVVSVGKVGRERRYRLEAEPLHHVHEWIRTFDRLWSRHIDRIRDRAERVARQRRR